MSTEANLTKLDESTINITSSSLRSALTLSAADRRWIDFLVKTITNTWDENNPSRPKTMGYMGSEEFIRLQFEEYLLALLSCVKYHVYLENPQNPPLIFPEGDPSNDFNLDWIHAWRQTSSFALFAAKTDRHLFEIVEPRHPTAGNLSFEDIQRRFALQIQTLHLDERLASSREALNKHLANGQKKFSTAFQNVWADIEAMREAQRGRAELASAHNLSEAATPNAPPISTHSLRFSNRAPDLSRAQASVSAASQRASAYISSWGTWASERRKGWSARTPEVNAADENVAVAGKEPESREGMSAHRGEKPLRYSGSTRRAKEQVGADGIGRLDV